MGCFYTPKNAHAPDGYRQLGLGHRGSFVRKMETSGIRYVKQAAIQGAGKGFIAAFAPQHRHPKEKVECKVCAKRALQV